jgi:hypothetical protein
VDDCEERRAGTDPQDPSDDGLIGPSGQVSGSGIDQVQGDGARCSLSWNTMRAPDSGIDFLVLMLCGLVLLMRRLHIILRSLSPRKLGAGIHPYCKAGSPRLR